MKNIFKENKEKLTLKRTGHFLIDRIKWKGYSKDAVYYFMAEELHIEESMAHFSKMNTLRELRPAVAALERIEKRLPKTIFASKGAKPRRRKSRPDLRQNIIAVRDQIAPKAVMIKKVKEPKPPKKDYGRNTLPRQEMLRVLEEMKQEREQRNAIESSGNILAHPDTLQPENKSILYKVKQWLHIK